MANKNSVNVVKKECIRRIKDATIEAMNIDAAHVRMVREAIFTNEHPDIATAILPHVPVGLVVNAKSAIDGITAIRDSYRNGKIDGDTAVTRLKAKANIATRRIDAIVNGTSPEISNLVTSESAGYFSIAYSSNVTAAKESRVYNRKSQSYREIPEPVEHRPVIVNGVQTWERVEAKERRTIPAKVKSYKGTTAIKRVRDDATRRYQNLSRPDYVVSTASAFSPIPGIATE